MLLTFNDILSEAQEPDLRTENQINEAQENIRAVIDRHFKAITKVTEKELDLLVNNNNKDLITTDGKWNIQYRRDGYESFNISDSSSFMKNGKSLQLRVTSKRHVTSYDNLPVIEGVRNVFKEVNFDIAKAVDKLKEVGDTETYYVRVEMESNKDEDKMNPFSMVKNVKPFTKTLERNMKIRKDDIIKMVVNGQIKKIVVDHHLTDDYHFDGAGREMDVIQFLKQDAFSRDPYISVTGNNGGDLYIRFSIHSNYSVALIPDEKKIKIKKD